MHSACLNYYFFLLIWIIIKRTVKEDFSLKKKPCSLLCLLEWFLKRSLFSKKKCQFHFLNRYFPPTPSRSPFDTHKICSRNKHFPLLKTPTLLLYSLKKILAIRPLHRRTSLCFLFPLPLSQALVTVWYTAYFQFSFFFSLSTEKKYTLKDDSRFR